MESETSDSPPPADGWHRAQPAALPGPTYVPALMGFGLVFLFWGLATSLYISGVGLMLTVLALIRWIGELRCGV